MSNKRKSYENAIDLSKFFADEIIPRANFVIRVLEPYNQGDFLLSPLLLKERLDFSKAEEEKLFPQNVYGVTIAKIFKPTKMEIMKGLALSQQFTDEYMQRCEMNVLMGLDKLPENSDEAVVHATYYSIIINTLNNLEYMSMTFNSGVADAEVVYQSLHQTYISMVGLLYHIIAQHNRNGTDKYFTNIIILYNLWKKKQIDSLDKEKGELVEYEEKVANQHVCSPEGLKNK